MVHRPSKNPFLAAVFLLAAAMPFAAVTTRAQEAPPVAPAQFDPSDVYFQAYLAARNAEKMEAEGNFVGAAEKLEQARKLIEGVRKYYPDWKPDMVKRRTDMNSDATARIAPKAEEQRKKNEGAVAELEGGVKRPGTPDPMPAPGVLDGDPLAARRLAEAQAEVERLRNQMAEARDTTESGRNASRVGDLRKENNDLNARLRAAEANMESLRARLAVSPAETEYKSLNKRIENLELEREAMARALSQSRNDHADAISRIRILEEDLKISRNEASELRQKQANTERDLKKERTVANEVVAGLRNQINAVEKSLKAKSDELEKANKRITGLELQLQQSNDAFTELRTERDALLVERDQMAALLKLNEAGRINQLIEQNMGLAKQLREASEKVERLSLEDNKTKDAWTETLRDLAMAKEQINAFRRERRDQEKRIEELQARLKGEESALARGEASADPAEIETLREIIKRQLRVQERRKQAKDMLVEAAKKLGERDENLAQAIELFDGEDIQLTSEEQQLIADRKADVELFSPFARDRATVGRATANLNHEMSSYDRAATKAYASERYLPAKELFRMIVESNPGDTAALCKLGLVEMKLEDAMSAADTFRRAVELDPQNPYAHRMLGLALIALGDLGEAEQQIARSTELAPDDAKNQMIYGAILYSTGRTSEAESRFKAAISADPMLSEPYINLAMLCARSKRRDAGREYYQNALERGAAPDPRLEKLLEGRP